MSLNNTNQISILLNLIIAFIVYWPMKMSTKAAPPKRNAFQITQLVYRVLNKELSTQRFRKQFFCICLSVFVYRLFHKDFSPIVGTILNVNMYVYIFFCSSMTLDRITMHSKFFPTRVRTHDLHITTVHLISLIQET